jgi:hypothetical protein
LLTDAVERKNNPKIFHIITLLLTDSVERSKNPNYKKNVMLQAISHIEPIGMEDWIQVAHSYQVLAKEAHERDPVDVKCYFIEKMCNKARSLPGSQPWIR